MILYSLNFRKINNQDMKVEGSFIIPKARCSILKSPSHLGKLKASVN